MKLRRVVNKFICAFKGIVTAFKIDFGVKTQFTLALITIVFGLLIGLTETQWLIVVVCIGAVLTAELLNTAIEEVVNSLSHLMHDGQRKRIKDISAGAVLTISLTSLIIMMLILWSKGVS
ncbi:MAG TPA: diacylglycerol kinase family protein [Erysipelothrix sp.]|nr:diacylglycerol kinase family protein [Erysipelothrix sp.]